MGTKGPRCVEKATTFLPPSLGTSRIFDSRIGTSSLCGCGHTDPSRYPSCMLTVILSRNWAKAAHHNTRGAKVLNKAWQKYVDVERGNQNQRLVPVIYWRVLCDDRRESLTSSQLDKLLQDLEQYPTDNQLGRQVDSQFLARPDLAPDRRHYKSKTLEKFLQETRNRINDDLTNENKHKPLRGRPIGYVGFTTSNRRLNNSHASRESSNHLMYLMEAACQRKFGRAWKMRYFVVHFIQIEEHASIAEIVLTLLSGCYIDLGGGFVDTHPGSSNSCKSVAPCHWATQQEWIDSYNTPYIKNMDAWSKDQTEMRTKTDRLRAAIDAEKLALAEADRTYGEAVEEFNDGVKILIDLEVEEVGLMLEGSRARCEQSPRPKKK